MAGVARNSRETIPDVPSILKFSRPCRSPINIASSRDGPFHNSAFAIVRFHCDTLRRVSSTEEGSFCGFTPWPRCTHASARPGRQLPRVTRETCSHIIMLLAEAREDPIPRSHITSSRPQELIISSCIPSLCIIFLSTDLSAVVFSFSFVYCEKKCTVMKSLGLLKTHFLVVNRVNVLKCI